MGSFKKGGTCFLKKVVTEHFHPVVPRAFGVYEAFSVSNAFLQMRKQKWGRGGGARIYLNTCSVPGIPHHTYISCLQQSPAS